MGLKNSVHSPVEPSVRWGIHLVQLMEDRVRGLVSEVVDDVLHTQHKHGRLVNHQSIHTPHQDKRVNAAFDDDDESM